MEWQTDPTPLKLRNLVTPSGRSEVTPRARFRQGPQFAGGELLEVLPGYEAVVLVSPTGDQMLLQSDGKTVMHVPDGWRILRGSQPLTVGPFRRALLDNIPELYEQARPYCG